MEDLKKFLYSKDLSAGDIGKGLVVHEVMGVSVLVGAWAACWAVKPSRHLIKLLQLKKTAEWRRAQEKMQKSKLVKLIKGSKYVSSQTASASELAVAFGESYLIRKVCMPILIPLKLWLTYEIILMMKPQKMDENIS